MNKHISASANSSALLISEHWRYRRCEITAPGTSRTALFAFNYTKLHWGANWFLPELPVLQHIATCTELSRVVPLYHPLLHSRAVVGHSLLPASRLASVQIVLICP